MRAKFRTTFDYEGMTLNHILAISTDEVMAFPYHLKTGRYIDIDIETWWYNTQRPSMFKITYYSEKGTILDVRSYGGRSYVTIGEIMSRLQLYVTNANRAVENEESAEILLKLDSMRSASMVDPRPAPVYEHLPLDDITTGTRIFTYTNDREFVVDCIGRHGQDCSQVMIGYRNIHPTEDAPAGSLWFLSESMVRKQFYVKELK